MKDEKLTGFLVFISWTLVLIGVASVVGYNGLYSQDSYEYLRYCVRLFEFIGADIPPGDYFWPVNYPLLGALLAFITGPHIALQLLSILAASWILYLLCMFLFSEFPGREREIIVYVLLFLGLSPYFFRYTISSMSDIPALAFACSAYYGLYRGLRYNQTVWLYATGFLAVMAVFTRFAFLPLMIPVVLYSGFCMLKNFRFLPVAAAVVAAFIPIIVYYFFKQQNSTLIFHHYLVTDWSFLNLFKSEFSTVDGNSEYIIPNLLFALSFLIHPGYLFPGIIFLYFIVRKVHQPTLMNPVLIGGMILYLLFIAGIPSRNVRYLLPLMPFYLVICFPGFLLVLSWLYKRKNTRTIIFAAAIVLQLILTMKAFLPFYQYNRLDKSIADKIIEHHPAVLYTFGIDGALQSYGYQGEIVNLWKQPLDTIKQDALLLFNRKKNEEQWRGMNPMLNYYMIVDKGKAVKIDELESGWEIYEVKAAYPDPDTRVSEIGK